MRCVVAARDLVLVVGDIGGEIGGLLVAADEHPVLVVAVGGGAEPYGVIQLVGVAGGQQVVDDALHVPLGVKWASR